MRNFKSIVALMILFCTACAVNAQSTRNLKNQGNNPAGAFSDKGGDFHIEGVGHNKTVTMNGGILHIEGADNNVTVKGFATKVIIQGASNSVTVDTVNQIQIQGADNQVNYRASQNKSGKPVISIAGADSQAVKIK